MLFPTTVPFRCCFVLIVLQLFFYSMFVLHILPMKRLSDRQKYSLKFNDSVVKSEIYMNGELNITETMNEEECARNFLQSYSKYCEKAIVPPSLVIRQHSSSAGYWSTKELCPCLSKNLTGKVDLNMSSAKLPNDIFTGMVPGGHWAPSWCIPRQRIAIIIPFRDRASHLDIFLQIFHPFLQKQLHSYSIFVIEQKEPVIFNKASVMNAGFMEIVKRINRVFDCFIFHDVDSLPQDDRNIYGCYKLPKHIAAYFDKLDYKLVYYKMFGGATGFTRKQFEASNGYSNEYWGWGGEDDDMEKRISAAGMTFLRYPKCVSKYSMIKHERDKNNPRNNEAASGWRYRPEVYKRNGLNTLSYTLVSYEERILYTKIVVTLNVSLPSTLASSTQTTRFNIISSRNTTK